MTFPSGSPGGYPGQGPQQPQQYPGAPAKAGPQIGLPQILLFAVAGLGVLNLFLGFANIQGETGFYETSYGWVPGLLFAGGLTALFSILPGDNKPGAWPAVLALASVLPFLFTIFSLEADLAAGGIMILIFGLIQAILAVVAYLFDTGVIKPPSPASTSPYGPYAQYGQYGQPYGQGPAPDQSGGIPQPQYGQQQPAQQPTQYASQQGQFFQQGPETGQRPPGS